MRIQRLASVFLPLGEVMHVDRSPAATAALRQEAHGRQDDFLVPTAAAGTVPAVVRSLHPGNAARPKARVVGPRRNSSIAPQDPVVHSPRGAHRMEATAHRVVRFQQMTIEIVEKLR